MKIAAVGDIHTRVDNRNEISGIVRSAANGSDVLLLCGDLTQNGLPEEAEVLRGVLREFSLPVVGVLGNHDYESGRQDDIAGILRSDDVQILRGEHAIIGGVGFAGTKGFAGGFDGHMLPKFGEPLLKRIVDEGTDEALLLEKALSQLETKSKIVLTHYAPVRSTVVGEPEEIFPFLGLTRLEGPINRSGAAMAFHGHGHFGTYGGKTSAGIPVYNVSLPILQKLGMAASLHEISD